MLSLTRCRTGAIIVTTKPKEQPSKSRAKAKETNTRIRRKNRGNDFDVADWDSVPAELLRSVIAAVTGRNCAVQFGYTRDGGAYVIRIVGDGEPYNEYVRPTEDVAVYLQGLQEDFAG